MCSGLSLRIALTLTLAWAFGQACVAQSVQSGLPGGGYIPIVTGPPGPGLSKTTTAQLNGRHSVKAGDTLNFTVYWDTSLANDNPTITIRFAALRKAHGLVYPSYPTSKGPTDVPIIFTAPYPYAKLNASGGSQAFSFKIESNAKPMELVVLVEISGAGGTEYGSAIVTVTPKKKLPQNLNLTPKKK